jgi:hypothetical protein
MNYAATFRVETHPPMGTDPDPSRVRVRDFVGWEDTRRYIMALHPFIRVAVDYAEDSALSPLDLATDLDAAFNRLTEEE